MVVGALGKKPARIPQQLGQWLVGIKNLKPCHIADLGKELPGIIHRDDDGDASRLTGQLVVLAISRSLVNNSGALARGDIVGNEDAPSISHIPGFDIGVVVKNPLVFDLGKL